MFADVKPHRTGLRKAARHTASVADDIQTQIRSLPNRLGKIPQQQVKPLLVTETPHGAEIAAVRGHLKVDRLFRLSVNLPGVNIVRDHSNRFVFQTGNTPERLGGAVGNGGACTISGTLEQLCGQV